MSKWQYRQKCCRGLISTGWDVCEDSAFRVTFFYVFFGHYLVLFDAVLLFCFVLCGFECSAQPWSVGATFSDVATFVTSLFRTLCSVLFWNIHAQGGCVVAFGSISAFLISKCTLIPSAFSQFFCSAAFHAVHIHTQQDYFTTKRQQP